MRYDYQVMLRQKEGIESEYKVLSQQMDALEQSVGASNGVPNFEGEFAD